MEIIAGKNKGTSRGRSSKFRFKNLAAVVVVLTAVSVFSAWLIEYPPLATHSSPDSAISHDIPKTDVDSVDFMQVLTSQEYDILYLSVKDEASVNLTSSVREALQRMGSTRISELGYRGSYVAVIENHKVVLEDLKSEGTAEIKFNRVLLRSSGHDFGSKSEIMVNGHNFSLGNRGINVLAQTKGHFFEQFSFDFYAHPTPKSPRGVMIPMPSDLHNIQIVIKKEDYQKLERKREEALQTGILLTTDEDLVPATITLKDATYQARIRLKGDWTDHLVGRKWSFRINLSDGATLFGMSRFNIHHPGTRNYLGDWLFHRALKREGIIGLRYSFLNAELKVVDSNKETFYDLGTYAMEESFDKYLLENNERRDGVVVKINEELMWEGTAQARKAGLNAGLSDFQLSDYSNMTILPFSQKKILSDPVFKGMFNTARDLYDGYIHGEIQASDAFEVKKLAKYSALLNLLGAHHGLQLHNQRLYYNPISGRLEPIGFDGNAGEEITEIKSYPFAGSDANYLKAFAAALEEVSQKSYLDSLLASAQKDLNKNLELLQYEFEGVKFESEPLYQNQKVILKDLYPSTAFHVFFVGIEGDKLELQLRSITPFPLEILNLTYKGQRIISAANPKFILNPKACQNIIFKMPQNFQNLFVSKKNKKALFSNDRDIEKILVSYQTYGTKITRVQKIIPWMERTNDLINSPILALKKPNVRSFKHLIVDEDKKIIKLRSGKLDKDLIIPAGYKVIGEEGLHIDLTSSAKIISYSPILLMGSAEKPILFSSSDGEGQGLLILNTYETSELNHVKFDNLTNPEEAGWKVTGAVNFYQSPVRFRYVAFLNNRSEDALNVIHSKFDFFECVFFNTQADAFDGDFVEGSMTNVHFENLGNDAIDISGSTVKVQNVSILRAGDKGISVGENSSLSLSNVTVTSCEIAVAAKDRSSINANGLTIELCKLGFTAFQKKQEFGPAKIEALKTKFIRCQKNYLIETRSSLNLNGSDVVTQQGVVERMYGVEYGKKSN